MKYLYLFLFTIYFPIIPVSLPAQPGTPLWYMVNALGSLSNALSTKVDAAEQTYRDITSCVVLSSITPPATIQQSGNYCLSSNSAGTITIDADNVTLDLNGHSLQGSVQVNAGRQQITINNGIIHNGGPGIHLVGTALQPIKDVNIQALLIHNCTNALLADHTQGLTVSNNQLFNNTTIGIGCSTCTQVTIATNTISGSQTGISFIENTHSTIKKTQVMQATINGISIDANSSCVTINACNIINSGGNGYRLLGENITLVNCLASGSTNGFTASGGNLIVLTQCQAKNNTNGFSCTNNFGYVNECTAISNNTGFLDSGSSVSYRSNLAAYNTTNYNPGATFSPTSTTSATNYWQNITIS